MFFIIRKYTKTENRFFFSCYLAQIMTENEFLIYCQSQISGPLKDEDIITMLTAWGSIKYTQGYNQALNDQAQQQDS